MKTYKIITENTEATEALGALLARAISSLESATVAMRGEMGVGKTAFVRGFASVFGIQTVKSPTYALLNEYRGKRDIFHFDMYRIETEDDLISIGYDDYLERRGYVICEWSENIDGYLPEKCIFVKISRLQNNEGAREIEIWARGIDLELQEGDLA